MWCLDDVFSTLFISIKNLINQSSMRNWSISCHSAIICVCISSWDNWIFPPVKNSENIFCVFFVCRYVNGIFDIKVIFHRGSNREKSDPSYIYFPFPLCRKNVKNVQIANASTGKFWKNIPSLKFLFKVWSYIKLSIPKLKWDQIR